MCKSKVITMCTLHLHGMMDKFLPTPERICWWWLLSRQNRPHLLIVIPSMWRSNDYLLPVTQREVIKRPCDGWRNFAGSHKVELVGATSSHHSYWPKSPSWYPHQWLVTPHVQGFSCFNFHPWKNYTLLKGFRDSLSLRFVSHRVFMLHIYE